MVKRWVVWIEEGEEEEEEEEESERMGVAMTLGCEVAQKFPC